MFTGESVGLSFPRGWYPLLEQLCQSIDHQLGDDKRGFQWVQIKEKFGTLRLYWHIENRSPSLRLSEIFADRTRAESLQIGGLNQGLATGDRRDLSDRINALMEAAEAATLTLCMACGGSGRQVRIQGCITTLCKAHTQQRLRGEPLQYWFQEEERD